MTFFTVAEFLFLCVFACAPARVPVDLVPLKQRDRMFEGRTWLRGVSGSSSVIHSPKSKPRK